MKGIGTDIKGILHCSGGAQTKCVKFGRNVHFVKDNLFPTPPLFDAIQKASGTRWEEMYKVYNMGHRMELYVPEDQVDNLISIAESYGIDAKRIGHTESSDINRLTLTNNDGNTYSY